MSELPHGWATCKVEDVFASFSGGTPSKSTPSYWNGNIPWISSGEFVSDVINTGSAYITKRGLENSSAKLCRPGSVVVVVRSGILKHSLPVAIVGQPLTINQDIKCFDAGNEDINRWLFLSLKTFAKEILSLNREGTTVQSVKYDTLKELKLPIPPLNEQRRIVAKLEKLLGRQDAAQARLATIPRILKRFRQSVLAAACSGRLSADWRILNKEITTWETCELGSICKFIGGSQPPKSQFIFEPRKGYIRLIQIRDYKSDNHLTFIPRDSARRTCTQDDVMIGRYGPPLFQILRGIEGAYNVALMKAVPRSSLKLLNDFLFVGLQDPTLQNFIINASERTVGQDGVRKDLLEQYEIGLPTVPEQQEIVRRVETLFKTADALEARYRTAKAHIDKLAQSILAKAFRGELVPQDPTDEPAAVLVEQLKESRINSKLKSSERWTTVTRKKRVGTQKRR